MLRIQRFPESICFQKNDMKRVLTLLLLISIALSFAACHNSEDPFTVSTDDISSSPVSVNDASDTSANSESSESAGNTTPPQIQADPEESFYSLSASKAYQKYGLFASTISMLNNCDGEHIYVMSAEGTLNRSDYPSGENQRPACTDPLCTHKPGSSCPFANLGSMFGIACYGDKLFYIGKDGGIYSYTPETNRSEVIKTGCSRAMFHRYCGNLYLINPEEDKDFNSVSSIYRITKDSKVINIGSVEAQFTNGFFVHSESTVVGFNLETPDGTSPAKVVLYDIVKKTSKTVFERSFSELSGDERDKASVVPMSIFGDKVLFSVRCSYQKSGKTIEISEIWLADVVNGQKRLLTKIQSLETGFYCHFSEKYICTVDWRNNGADHYIMHFLDPYSGKESTYDLSETAMTIDETIPLTDCHLSTLNRFAPLLSKTYWIPYTAVNDEGEEYTAYRLKQFKYLTFDLESGRVFKYPEPDPSELSA